MTTTLTTTNSSLNFISNNEEITQKMINLKGITPKMINLKGITPNSASVSPLSPEVMKNQATINLGTIGHVAHGKTTLVFGISGTKTNKHSGEQRRNMTIKLGYANFKIFKCQHCPAPQCYRSWKSDMLDDPTCDFCESEMDLVRHFSFVDCPGHDCLMSTMLNGAAVMDAALLIVAADVPCPQPQAAEHLAAAEIMKLKNIIPVQTKLDLVDMQKAQHNHREIRQFIGDYLGDVPVIPVACTPVHHYNVDVLLQYLCEQVPVPERDLTSPFLMQIVRSFDVNNPGIDFEQLRGGVAGGTLSRGILKVDQTIEIRPGILKKQTDTKGHTVWQYKPIITKVKSLYSEKTPLEFAIPGGLIAVGTTLDPTLTKSDRLVGQIIGEIGKLPEVYVELEIEYFLIRSLVGLFGSDEEKKVVRKLSKGETLLFNIGSFTVLGLVTAKKGSFAKVTLRKPCCIELESRISMSRNIEGSYRLVGFAVLRHGVPLSIST